MRFLNLKKILRQAAKSIGIKALDGLAALLATIQQPRDINPTAFYILVLKPLGVGDVMMLSPCIQKIADLFPQASTFLVTEYKPFLQFDAVTWIHPDDVPQKMLKNSTVISPTLSWRHIPYARCAGSYIGYFLSNRLMSNFAVVDYRYNARSAHYFERARAIVDVFEKKRVDHGKKARYPGLKIEKIGMPSFECDYVGMAPFSNWPERQYAVQAYIQMIHHLARKLAIVLIGGNQDAESALADYIMARGPTFNVINLVGQTTIAQAADIIQRAKVFIGNDSGLAHMAFLCQVPSVVIFGCVGGQLRIPIDQRLTRNIVALGAGPRCRWFPCYSGFSPPVCRNKERFICLNGVAVETVLEQVDQFIRRPN